MLAIVTGLKSEARILRGLDVVCISVGGKAASAPDRIAQLIEGGATGLASFGIAGALHPDLRSGDVIVADAVTEEGGRTWLSHAAWSRALAPSDHVWEGEPGSVRLGAILGLDHLLCSPAEKAEAHLQSAALAIDMESHHVARAAAEHNIPFIAIRAISDRADETLPGCLADFVNEEGGTKMSAVLAALISRRVKLGELIDAGRASRRAHRALFGCRGAVAGLR